MTRTIRKAISSDIDTVLSLLNDRIYWLEQRDISQWANRNFRDTIVNNINQGFTWLAYQDDKPIATLTLSTLPDRDFWTEAECNQRSLYLSKMATSPAYAGKDIGKDLLHWALIYAQSFNIPRLRWDAWRDNQALSDYYVQTGAKYIRTEAPDHRKSGALFEFSWKAVHTSFDNLDSCQTHRIPNQRQEVHYPDEDAEREKEQPFRTHILEEFICPPLYVQHETKPQALSTGCTSTNEIVPFVVVFYTGRHWRAHDFFSHKITSYPGLETLQKGLPYNVVHKGGDLECGLYLCSP